MINSDAFEAYISPHMMPSVGIAGGGGQRQQLWDWVDATTTQNPSVVFSQVPSLFTAGSASNTFYDCAAVNFASVAAGSGPPDEYCFYPAGVGGEYPTAQGHIKSEEEGVLGKIGLNLGCRTYFPMVCQKVPRCQAEGCKADLSMAKHYHRRHKVCEYHSKATVVVASGLQQRFCQQCSRFHVLSEFDEAKRSCRKRLADHNRRRRKAQPLSSVSTAAIDHSVSPSSTRTAEKQETSLKPMEGTGNIVNHTTTGISTISTASPTDVSLGSAEEFQKKASPLRNRPALSLAEPREQIKEALVSTRRTVLRDSGMSFQMSTVRSSLQQQHSTPSSSSISVFHHNFYVCSSNDASLTASGAGCDQAQNQNSLLHHAQGIFQAE